MIKIHGKKVTANKAAKVLLMEHGVNAVDCWKEFIYTIEPDLITEKEAGDLDACLVKQYDRLITFFNV